MRSDFWANEFVVFDASGSECDWIDPYEWHEAVSPSLVRVSNTHHEYDVSIPVGGHFEIRPRRVVQ